MITKPNARIGSQYRHPRKVTFGVGKVTYASLGVVNLVNSHGQELTVPLEDLTLVDTTTAPLSSIIKDAVDNIKSTINLMNTLGELPWTRTLADLTDHVEVTALVANHIPEVFPRDANGPMHPNQVQVCNVVFDTVDKWLTERWDNDPYNQPAPATEEAVRDILVGMLNMSHDEQQWGNARSTTFTAEAGPHPTVCLNIDGQVFRVEVRHCPNLSK